VLTGGTSWAPVIAAVKVSVWDDMDPIIPQPARPSVTKAAAAAVRRKPECVLIMSSFRCVTGNA
jgi:hypothetical protein